MEINNRENRKQALLFVAITLGCSWSLAIAYFSSGLGLRDILFYPMSLTFMWMPAFVSIFLQRRRTRSGNIFQELGVFFHWNQWMVYAWLFPAILALLSLAVNLLFPGIDFTPDVENSIIFERLKNILPPEKILEMKNSTANQPLNPLAIAILSGLIGGPTVNAIAAMGEESGWRGFLQRELAYLGFWRSSLLIGVIWGIWHAPIIYQGYNYPEHPLTGIFMMVVLCTLLAPIVSFVRLKAKSVVAAAVLHGSFNGTAGITLMVLHGGSDLNTGVLGAAGFIVMFAVNLLIFFVIRKEPMEILEHSQKS